MLNNKQKEDIERICSNPDCNELGLYPAPKSRDKLREYLRDLGIDTGIHWQPGHKFSFLKNTKRGDLSNTDVIADQILSLPLHSNMLEEEVNHIIDSINNFI